jgi:hypothetical protein
MFNVVSDEVGDRAHKSGGTSQKKPGNKRAKGRHKGLKLIQDWVDTPTARASIKHGEVVDKNFIANDTHKRTRTPSLDYFHMHHARISRTIRLKTSFTDSKSIRNKQIDWQSSLD